MKNNYKFYIKEKIPFVVSKTNLPYPKFQGKTRDVYDLGDNTLLIINTDRISAFDSNISNIPFKGKIINQISSWWFEKTKNIIPNHMISISSLNEMRVKKCKVFPIEIVVRGFITGNTKTSLWNLYQSGVRNILGKKLPNKLIKNGKLPFPIITPTTKSHISDKPLLNIKDIIKNNFPSEEQWNFISKKSIELFLFGQKIARKSHLLLVDTKYEFGIDNQNNIILVDECHTPDSSRYWKFKDYQKHFQKGKEIKNFDKEFLRKWYIKQINPYQEKKILDIPEEIKIEISYRYIQLFEKLTGKSFF